MDTISMRASYSIIGNCVDFLKNNEQNLRRLFSDFEVSSKDETLNDGTTVKSLMFTKGTHNYRFLTNRVDCTISLPTPTTPMNYTLQPTIDFFEKLKSLTPQLKGNRVAIVAQGFIQNPQNKAIAEFNKKMGFTRYFGESNELHFKINNPLNSFEPLNNVLNVDMGEAKNNKTGEVSKVLLVSIDVNTLAANTTERFTPDNAKPLFAELLKIAEAKLKALNKY